MSSSQQQYHGILRQVPAELIFDILRYLDFVSLKPLIFCFVTVDYYLPTQLQETISLGLSSLSNVSNGDSGGSGSGSGSSSSVGYSDGFSYCSLPIKHLFGDEFGIARFGIYLKMRFIESIPGTLKLSHGRRNSFDDIYRELEKLFVHYNPMMSKNLKRIGKEFEEERIRVSVEYKIQKYLDVTVTNENFMEFCRNYRHASKIILENWGKYGYGSESNLRYKIPGNILVAFKEVYKNLVKPLKNIHDEKATSKNPYMKALIVVVNSMNECAKYFKLLNRDFIYASSRLANDYPIPVELFGKFWRYLDNPLTYEPLLHMVTNLSDKRQIIIDICNYFSNMKPPRTCYCYTGRLRKILGNIQTLFQT
ncbi:predicted protein [Naegleria gruberi]|uniref:Predicted protein n=1 Tax=Naegleria gruberi TaxID=5762 RepID=D2W0L8_NAEGR|nr:uncharacterized protein NAEGRDRAFT_74904 [Naegleria gruberi]EFC37360.1 predicted protein [Naegleria gruberi]|eukprot:XP_002670104.1 predicted protein [Naegleria gruberi strain NEG-M]